MESNKQNQKKASSSTQGQPSDKKGQPPGKGVAGGQKSPDTRSILQSKPAPSKARAALAAKRLPKAAGDAFAAWSQTKPDQASPTVLSRNAFADYKLEDIALLMDAVAQSPRSDREIEAALAAMIGELQVRFIAQPESKEWTLQAVVSAISALGKSPHLPICQTSLALFLLILRHALEPVAASTKPVVNKAAPGAKAQASAMPTASTASLDTALLALLVNRLSKFSMPLTGDTDHYAELEQAIDGLAAKVMTLLSDPKPPQLTFKQVSQLVNGFGKFRQSKACIAAMGKLVDLARAPLADALNTPMSDDELATGMSIVNLCAYINGIAAFSGESLLTRPDHGDGLQHGQLRESVAAAAKVAIHNASSKSFDLFALGQLVRGFSQFSDVQLCCDAVVSLAGPTMDLLSAKEKVAQTTLDVRSLSMLAGGFGTVAKAVGRDKRQKFDSAVAQVIATLPPQASDYQACRTDLLAFLLHGLSRYQGEARGVLLGIIEALGIALRVVSAQPSRAALNRVDTRSLVVAADAIRRMPLRRSVQPVIGLIASTVKRKLALASQSLPWVDRMSATGASLLLRAFVTLGPQASIADRKEIEAVVELLAARLGPGSELSPLAMSQALAALALFHKGPSTGKALSNVSNQLIQTVKAASTPDLARYLLQNTSGIAQGLAQCLASGAVAREFGLDSCADQLSSYVSSHGKALAGDLTFAELLSAVRAFAALTPWCKAASAAAMALSQAAVNVLASSPDAELGLRSSLLSVLIEGQEASHDPGARAWYQKSVAVLLQETAEAVKVGKIANRDILLLFDFVGRRDMAAIAEFNHLLAASFKALAKVPSQAWSLGELWTVLSLLRNAGGFAETDQEAFALAQDLWAGSLAQLQGVYAEAGGGFDLPRLALMASRFAVDDASTALGALSRQVVGLCATSLLQSGSVDWWTQCSPETIAQVASSLARSGLRDELNRLLLLVDKVRLPQPEFGKQLQSADASAVVAWCTALLTALRAAPTSPEIRVARDLLMNLLPVAWEHLGLPLGAQGKAQPPITDQVVLLHYLAWKCGLRVSELPPVPPAAGKLHSLDAPSAKKVEESVAVTTSQCAQCLQKLGGLQQVGRATWNLIAQLEGDDGELAALSTEMAKPLAVKGWAGGAKFDWRAVFKSIGAGAPKSPQSQKGIRAIPKYSLAQLQDRPIDARSPRYRMLSRLTDGQLNVIEVRLPSDVDARLLKQVHRFGNEDYRIDVAGGNSFKAQREALDVAYARISKARLTGTQYEEHVRPGKVFGVPVADTVPGTAFSDLMQALFPNVEAFYYFQRALMNEGPGYLDTYGPQSHVLEGSFDVLFVPDSEPFALNGGGALRTHDGFGFIKQSVAQNWPWFERANIPFGHPHAAGPSKPPPGQAITTPLHVLGGTDPEANLVPDALQHYPADDGVAAEIVGDVRKVSLDGVKSYRFLTQGAYGKGHIAKAVPSSDGCVHLPSSKKVGPHLVTGRSPYEAAKLQAIEDKLVSREGATTKLLDSCVWVQYSFIGQRQGQNGDVSFLKGALLVVPDELFPEAYRKCHMIVSSKDEKTRSSWTGTEKALYLKSQVQTFSAILAAVEVFAPGSCVAIPPPIQEASGGDFDGDEALLVSGLPKFHAHVTQHRSDVQLKGTKSYRPAFRDKVYYLERSEQLASITRNVLGSFTMLQRKWRFIPAGRPQEAMSGYLVGRLFAGIPSDTARAIERLLAAKVVDKARAQECHDQLAIRLELCGGSSKNALAGVIADLATFAGLAGGPDKRTLSAEQSDPLAALLGEKAEVPKDPRRRLVSWLKALPRPPAIPADLVQLIRANGLVNGLDRLLLAGIKAGEDAFKSDTRIDDLHPLGTWLKNDAVSLAAPPYTRATALLMAEGSFDAAMARYTRDILQGKPNLAAAVMLEGLRQMMDVHAYWPDAEPYKPPTQNVSAKSDPLASRQLKGLCAQMAQALNSNKAGFLNLAAERLRRAPWGTAELLVDDIEAVVRAACSGKMNEAAREAATAALASLGDRLVLELGAKRWNPGKPLDYRPALARFLVALRPTLNSLKSGMLLPVGPHNLFVTLTEALCPDIAERGKGLWTLMCGRGGFYTIYYLLFMPLVCTWRPDLPALTEQLVVSGMAGPDQRHAFFSGKRNLPDLNATMFKRLKMTAGGNQALDMSTGAMLNLMSGKEAGAEQGVDWFTKGMMYAEPWFMCHEVEVSVGKGGTLSDITGVTIACAHRFRQSPHALLSAMAACFHDTGWAPNELIKVRSAVIKLASANLGEYVKTQNVLTLDFDDFSSLLRNLGACDQVSEDDYSRLLDAMTLLVQQICDNSAQVPEDDLQSKAAQLCWDLIHAPVLRRQQAKSQPKLLTGGQQDKVIDKASAASVPSPLDGMRVPIKSPSTLMMLVALQLRFDINVRALAIGLRIGLPIEYVGWAMLVRGLRVQVVQNKICVDLEGLTIEQAAVLGAVLGMACGPQTASSAALVTKGPPPLLQAFGVALSSPKQPMAAQYSRVYLNMNKSN